jgi:transcriptional regulator with XRE-family HTH domain
MSPTRQEVATAFAALLQEHLQRMPGRRAAVARSAGIARSYLYKLSRGREQPSLSVFISLCDALSIHDIEAFAELSRRLGRPLPVQMEGLVGTKDDDAEPAENDSALDPPMPFGRSEDSEV